MKAIICGSRCGELSWGDYVALCGLQESLPITEVVTGGASGIDTQAHIWAKVRRLRTRVFGADWKAWGRYAGPQRNRQMAEYAEACIIFPGGRGTEDMTRQANNAHLIVIQIADGKIIFDSRSHTPPASPPSPDTPGSDGFAGRAEG